MRRPCTLKHSVSILLPFIHSMCNMKCHVTFNAKQNSDLTVKASQHNHIETYQGRSFLKHKHTQR